VPALLFGLVAAAMAALTWQLWLLPSLLYKAVRLVRVPTLRDWEQRPPEAEARAWLTGSVEALESLGFAPGRRTCVEGEMASSVAWRCHLRHPDSRVRAAATAWALDEEGGTKPLERVLTLQVEGIGGRLLVATTAAEVQAELHPERFSTLVLASETEPGRVVTAFESWLEEVGRDVRAARRSTHDGPTEVAVRRQEVLAHHRELGLVRLDEQSGSWRLTWTGACMHAFYAFWPLRRRALARQRRLASRLLGS